MKEKKDTGGDEKQNNGVSDPDISINPGLLEIPHTIGSALVRPEDMGKTKGRAMTAMRQQTHKQMSQIIEQMHVLAGQARDIRKRIAISEKIYMAQMGFEPIIGQIYFLYLKKDGGHLLSMISPSEWGRSMPYEKYISSIKLLADHTWEILESEVEI